MNGLRTPGKRPRDEICADIAACLNKIESLLESDTVTEADQDELVSLLDELHVADKSSYREFAFKLEKIAYDEGLLDTDKKEHFIKLIQETVDQIDSDEKDQSGLAAESRAHVAETLNDPEIQTLIEEIHYAILSMRQTALNNNVDEIGHLPKTIITLVERIEKMITEPGKAGLFGGQLHTLKGSIGAVSAFIGMKEMLSEDVLRQNLDYAFTECLGQIIEIEQNNVFSHHEAVNHLLSRVNRMHPKAQILLEDELEADFSFTSGAKEALWTLIENACQMADEPQIIILFNEAKGRITIKVSDNGPGIDPSVRDKIFTSESASTKGTTGVGLFHAKQAIEAMNGKLELAESSPKGTTFVIHLER